MIEHGQGYEDSGRPMIVVAEVWPVAADDLGLWLLSGDGPRPSLPVMDDSEPFDYAEMELMQAGRHVGHHEGPALDLLAGGSRSVGCHLPSRRRLRGTRALKLAGRSTHQCEDR
jgi:hypothetical protein